MAANAWKVTLNRKEIDIVFFDKDCNKEYVYNSLVNHDGYDPEIKVSKIRKKRG